MKTLKKIPLKLVEVKHIPSEMEFGKFYYSEEFSVANHLCPCGCGEQVPVPVKKGEWAIYTKKPLAVSPSFQRRLGCKSHYIITNGNANIV
ncbi:MAG TPA: DUF6527 family protein [Flavobacterium sp.]|nr:DUF6527 family protein [Flavobacterium sp.]